NYLGRTIRCVAKYTELLAGLPYVDEVVSYEDPQLFTKAIQDHDVVDLTGTLLAQPNRRSVVRHLVDLLCERAEVANDAKGPECVLTTEEKLAAAALVSSLSVRGRPVIVMATRTSTPNKE